MATIQVARRGDTYRRVGTLANSNQDGDPWTFGMFSRIIWTLRTKKLESATEDLLDANAVAQVRSDQVVADKSIEEHPDDEGQFILRVGPTLTTNWPIGDLFFDIQGVIDGSPTEVHTLQDGQLRIAADVGRRTS